MALFVQLKNFLYESQSASTGLVASRNQHGTDHQSQEIPAVVDAGASVQLTELLCNPCVL